MRTDGPPGIIWDLTYACPFRCEHCCTESGRRPSRHQPLDKMLKIVDAFVAHTPPPSVMFAGGEPLIVKGLLDIAARVKDGGASGHLYTSGWRLDRDFAERAADVFHAITVSMDSPDPAVDDFLRGREGAFDEAMNALRLWNDVAEGRKRAGQPGLNLGITCTVARSNVDHLDRFCTEIVPRLPNLTSLSFGVVMTLGLASRDSYCERELLTDEQVASMPGLRDRIKRMLPGAVKLNWRDVPGTLRLARGELPRAFLAVGPDGVAKAHSFYEATVGHVLEQPLDVLWRRSLAWSNDPFVRETLGSIRSMADWARVARFLDMRYGSLVDQRRILQRGPVLAMAPRTPIKQVQSA